MEHLLNSQVYPLLYWCQQLWKKQYCLKLGVEVMIQIFSYMQQGVVSKINNITARTTEEDIIMNEI
jgi:hypothetical protein